jgi:hypothetical protein
MAKKVVAAYKTGVETKSISKVIRMVKSQKSGAYEFREEFIESDRVKDLLSGKKK